MLSRLALALTILFCGISSGSADDTRKLPYDIAPGFRTTSVIEKDLVPFPIHSHCLDDAGRLFVADHKNRIFRLADSNQDGVYDKKRKFADGPDNLGGMLWLVDSLIVTGHPGLLMLMDENADGKAEVTETLVDGFDFTSVRPTPPMLHPDGRVHWAHSATKVVIPAELPGEPEYSAADAAHWSCQISGGDLRRFTGTQPFPIHDLVTNVSGDLIARSHGKAYRVAPTQSVDLAPNENIDFFSPIQPKNSKSKPYPIAPTADGDWLALAEGEVLRITLDSASTPFTPFPYRDMRGWHRLQTADLIELLDADSAYVCERSMKEFAIRGAVSITALRDLFESGKGTPQAKRNAIWTLSRMKFSESPDLIFTMLSDANPTVQQAACKALAVTRGWQNIAIHQPYELKFELERNDTIAGALIQLVRTAEDQVARDAVWALGEMADPRAIGAMITRAGQPDTSKFLFRDITHALIQIDDFETTALALESENPRKQATALYALSRMSSGQLTKRLWKPFADSPHPLLRQVIDSLSQ
ncbi:MAG: hypothetical protein AAF226_06425 [Verrucomicrobiota bacterium]